MLTEFVNLLLVLTAKFGYGGIVVLMAVESSFIPFPSEVVVPPAAYMASIGEMNIWLVIISGIFGSLIGASVNYFLAKTLGRTIIYKLVGHKFAKMLLLSEEKLKNAEAFFLKYGNISTFVGRLIPAVRQLISIPAGFAKMKLRNFYLFTFLGSGAWTVVLAVLGYTLGSNKELLEKYYNNSKYLFVVAAIIIVITYLVIKSRKKKAEASK